MNAPSWNWRLWAGFLAVLVTLIGYLSLFPLSGNPRLVFWPSMALLLAGVLLLLSGLQRAVREPQSFRGRISGPILAGLTLLLVISFGYVSYEVFRNFPAARNAPKIGQFAPDFSLPDSEGNHVSLSRLLGTPITDSSTMHASRGVLLVFYRGYW